ncbi:MAG: phosphatidate cytidylyltransferase [bacterium]|nr:phosphatidate cytidylyltransferase [bacterium]
MSNFVSRLVVTLIGLPVVLGAVYLGAWWLFALVAAAALVGLHEFYSMARPLRPLVLAGYGGVAAMLIGARLGGIDWMLGGFLATFLFAFLLYLVATTRAPATVAVGGTVLGASWVGFGLGFLLLLRDLPQHGRLVAFAVLIAVWADDTAAYLVGRALGRHKFSPALSPAKTWEGFLAGTAAAIAAAFVTFYKQHFLTIGQSIALGVTVAVAAALGDLFESAVKRDMQVKDSGRLLAGHGGVLDRVDAFLFALPAAYFAIAALT